MDSTPAVTHLGLCAGYGGIELGLKRAVPGLRTVALCEIEAFAIANLVSKMEAGLMDPAPIWPDLKTFPWAAFRDRVDILTGGYPCQPFSAAGQRRGKDDPRHLWPYIADGIRLLRPRCCFFENVEGHISLGLSDVIEDLAGMGYRTTWGIFSASECGAPHQRKRVFILANRCDTRLQGTEWIREAGTERPPSGHTSQCNGSVAVASSLGGKAGLSGPFTGHEGQPGESDDGGYKVMADAQLHGCNHAEQRPHSDGIQGPLGQEHEHGQTLGDGQLWPSRPGEQQYAWEPPRVVGNSEDRSNRQHSTEQQGRSSFSRSSGEELGDPEGGTRLGSAQRETGHAAQSDQNMADTSISGSDGRSDGTSGRSREPGEVSEDAAGCGGESNGMRQTQPPLGRDTDGPASGLDYAELCVTCDNRTDELRLLGNGVVPATAERAFRSLMRELYTDHPVS